MRWGEGLSVRKLRGEVLMLRWALAAEVRETVRVAVRLPCEWDGPEDGGRGGSVFEGRS